jgi:hypothetical protein
MTGLSENTSRSRRAVLAGIVSAAALPIAAATTTAALAAVPAADPVFELIDLHRKTHAAHLAAIEVLNRFQEAGDYDHDGITDKPCHDANGAFNELVAAPAATLSGLHAKVAYLQELESEFETAWLIFECVDASDLIESFAVSLKNIGPV